MQVISQKPLSETEILSDDPIRFQAGELELFFPLLTFREYQWLNKAVKLLGVTALIVDEKLIPQELVPVLTEVYAESPAFVWWDTFGLPYIISKYAKPSNKKTAIETINKYIDENPSYFISNIDEQSTEIEFRIALSVYMACTTTPEKMIECFNILLEMQYTIKKKLKVVLTNQTQEAKPEDLQHSPSSRAALESIRRKRLRVINTP